MYGYTGIRPYEETCDQYMWYGTRVRCSFKNLRQQKLLKLGTNSVDFCFLLLRCFFLQVGALKCDDWGCMFQHCWFGCIFVCTKIIKPRAPLKPPQTHLSAQASVAETFLSAGLHSNMGGQEAIWDQLIRVACELPN